MKTLKTIFQVLGLIAALMSLIPLIAADYWWIRFFDFPHIHFTTLTFIAIVLYFFTFNYKTKYDYLYITVLLGCFVFQLSKFIDYTPVWAEEMQASSENLAADKVLSVMTVNVLQKNDKHDKIISQIKEVDPDIVLFTETDSKWMNALQKSLGSTYPHKINQPQDNTYGMMLYSKLELVDGKVLFQVDKKIPSIHSKVKMRDGKEFLLMGIHPTPPAPTHNPNSTDRDTELIKTAIKSYQSDIPVVVLGDFNDVSWSRSTELLKTIGKLIDYRRGRGFYNTYNANYTIVRWPLDHVLVTSDFRLKDSGVGEGFGSDHFPTWVKFTLEPELADQQKATEPTDEEWKRAKDQMSKQGMSDFESLPDAFDEISK